jgi:hypothetical protein
MDKIIEEMALDIMRVSSLPLEISGAIATDLAEIGYRKQVEAEWIDLHKGKYENPLYVCSACRKGAYLKVEADELNNPKMVQALTPYCPHCSAKMKGAE